MAGALPASSEAIDADWLNAHLSADVRGGATIISVAAAIIGERVGFLGEVARLSLTYDNPSSTSTGSLISKIPTTNEGYKQMGLALGMYQKEFGFFRDVAPEMKVRIPRCHINLSERDIDFILVVEDLAPMRSGDQLASCSLEEAERALTAVAPTPRSVVGRSETR